jgi:hypothetical protein
MPPARDGGLPFVDEHRLSIAAPAAEVWRALEVEIRRFGASEAFARVLGAVPRQATGTPLEEGATCAAFAIARW